ncbi:hypothetical protein OK016_12825 [Vibrio chagasii]|nr:hypothetical protein [Vibrio chagasii]
MVTCQYRCPTANTTSAALESAHAFSAEIATRLMQGQRLRNKAFYLLSRARPSLLSINTLSFNCELPLIAMVQMVDVDAAWSLIVTNTDAGK